MAKGADERLTKSLVVVTSRVGDCLHIELYRSDDLAHANAMAAFDLPVNDPALFHSRAAQVGVAVVVASLGDEEIPAALAADLGDAVRMAEQTLRRSAEESVDGKFLLMLHLAAEARSQKSLACLYEADAALQDLLQENYGPAIDWARTTWPRLREFTVRSIEQSK